MVKRSGYIYESSYSQIFRTTTGKRPVPDTPEEPRGFMTIFGDRYDSVSLQI